MENRYSQSDLLKTSLLQVGKSEDKGTMIKSVTSAILIVLHKSKIFLSYVNVNTIILAYFKKIMQS